MNATPPVHAWRFFRAGGFDQVRLAAGEDLLHLGELDQKLWVALSCPVDGLEFDRRTLALIDTDGDGHIRAPELIAAVQWAAARLRSPEFLRLGAPLPLAAIDDGNAAGARLLASARHVLDSLGRGGADAISVEDASDSARILAGMAFNGDGVITAAACGEGLLPAFADIVACLGSVPDRSGDAGIDQAGCDRFFAEARAWQEWRIRGESEPDLLPLGAASEAAFAALAAVRAKIDDFFSRCRLAAFDPRAGQLLNGDEEELRRIASRDLALDASEIAALPIARINPEAILPLAAGINPAWQAAVGELRRVVTGPLLGEREQLDFADWLALMARFAAYEKWLAARPENSLSALPAERLAALLAPDVQAAFGELIARDRAMAPEAEAIAEVERLVRYVRDLGRLADNFVSFRDFYSGSDKGIFQAGTLYLDGRSCELCLKVLDPARHATLATLSGVYLAYCDCVRGGERMSIAAAFTAGDSDQLMVGRNGVFYDRQGRDWDATITRIVDHPISIRQAFWSPYRKATRLIAEQVQKFASAKAKAADELAAAAVAGAKPEAGKPTTTPFDAARFAGIFAAIGLAVGAIGTAFASLISGFLGLPAWQMPLAIAGLALLISGPAVAMAYFKLRNRNLGPLLDANGWAVNARARINIPFGTALTRTAQLPAGAERSLGDPYAERPGAGRTYFFLALGLFLAAALVYIGIIAARH